MDVPSALRQARLRAGVTQQDLAERAGTSQATVSAYEAGAKTPSIDTFERLLAATGSRLAVTDGHAPLVKPSARRQARAGRALAEVLGLAEALPTRHEPELRFPRLGSR